MADTTIKLSGTYDSIEAYELLEEMRGVASDYLLKTGGTITGDLNVNGQIFGDLTGDVTGNADTATSATNDGNGNEISTTYLPLSGGELTGNVAINNANGTSSIANNNSTGGLNMFGYNSSSYEGAALLLSSVNNVSAGKFFLRSPVNSNDFMQLVGDGVNGTLQWNSKEVERVNAKSTNYIRFESGLQLCWGTVTNVNSSGVSVTFPASFNATPAIMLSTTASSHCWYTGGSSTGFSAKSAGSSATVVYLAVGFWK